MFRFENPIYLYLLVLIPILKNNVKTRLAFLYAAELFL